MSDGFRNLVLLAARLLMAAALLPTGIERALNVSGFAIVLAGAGLPSPNALATAAMLRAGADQVATGENAVVVCAGMADLILCPIGMVLCDAMLGEVTANMALAVGRSKAHKILLPVSRCQASVAGAPHMSMAEVVAKAVEETVARVSAASV